MILTAGVDVGGTKIDACIANAVTGGVQARERIPTLPEQDGSQMLGRCVALVRRLAAGRRLASIGIGVCEFVDRAGGLTSSQTIRWSGLDVRGAFETLAPTAIESDVRAAALAEARFGAGRGIADPWIYISVGTGISYSLVLDGRPFEGARGNAIVVGAPPAERIASGLGIARTANRGRAEDVLGEPACAEIVSSAASALGGALAMLANALDPARIVIGGGLGLEPSYREVCTGAMRDLIEARATRDVPVMPAALGDLAGPLGAVIVGSERAGTDRR